MSDWSVDPDRVPDDTTRLRRARRRVRAVAMIMLGAVMTSTGCVAEPIPTDELVAQARTAFVETRDLVGSVLVEIRDAEWVNTLYGDWPDRCDGGYFFALRRDSILDDWRFEEGSDVAVQHVAQSLTDAGWTDVRVLGYGEGIATTTIEARWREAGINRLTVQLTNGPTQDGATVWAESVCHPGNYEELRDALRDLRITGTDAPPTEHPNAPATFAGHPVTPSPAPTP